MGTLAAAAAALLIAGGLAGCDNPAGQARIVGDTVYLPETCTLFKERRTKPEDMPFVKFDGEYPDGWPTSAKLPVGTHLYPDGRLQWVNPARPGGSRFVGICPGSHAGVVADWKARIVAGGWTIGRVFDDEGAAFPTGQAVGDTTIMAEDPVLRPQPYLQLTVWKHYNTGGWVYFECFVYMAWQHR